MQCKQQPVLSSCVLDFGHVFIRPQHRDPCRGVVVVLCLLLPFFSFGSSCVFLILLWLVIVR